VKQNAPLFAFNHGEVSKIALGRVDIEKLRLAAQCQVNWLPWTVGPMMLRPGLQFVGEALGDAVTRLVRFVFAKLDTALIELTPNTMRVYVDDLLVTRNAVGTTVSDPNFQTGSGWVTSNTTSGASVQISNGAALTCTPVGGLAQLQQTLAIAPADRNVEHAIRITVTNGPVTMRIGSAAGLSDLIGQTVLDTGSHSLAFTPPGAAAVLQIESTDAWAKTLSAVLIEAAGAMQVPTPWSASDLPNIRYDQSGDVIFCASYGLPQRKIERRAAHSWSVTLYRSSNGPFQSAPALQANFTPSAYYGNGTLTSDRPYFQSAHVGCLFRLFSNGQFYQTSLGASNAFTPPVQVSGVGSSRNYSWTVIGSYGGVLSFQRSFNGPNSGFVDVATGASGATGAVFSSSTGGTSGTPDLDNIICWERVGFEGGNYASGNCAVVSSYSGDGGFAIVRCTGFVSATQINIEILQPFPSLQATNAWLEQDWSAVIGYPDSCCFFDGRLFWFGRDEFWGSESNNFTGYSNQDTQGNDLGDAGALNEQFGAGPVDTVSWGLGLFRLLAGREGSITSIRSNSFDEVLTPTNVSAKDCSTNGAMRLPAVKYDMNGIYVEQSNRRVYELVFSPQALDYASRDLTRLNLDIGKPGFVDFDLQRQPDGMIYAPLANGQAAALLHEPAEQIDCWWRLQTAGVIENVAVLPSNGTPGFEQVVYFVVRRVINGVTRRFIEKLAARDACVGALINQQADCHGVYQGPPIRRVTIPWLPNTLVTVWADGAAIGTQTTDAAGNCVMPDGNLHSNVVVGLGGTVITGSTANPLPNGVAPDQTFLAPSNTLNVPASYNGFPCEVFADIGGTGKPVHIGCLTVASGQIALPNNAIASVITACLGYVAPFMSAKLAYAAQKGSPLGQKKRIGHIGLIAYDMAAQACLYGQRFDALDPLPQVEAGQATPAGTVWSEYDEPLIEAAGEWNTDARLCLLAQAPNPCTIGGVTIDINTSEK